MYKTKNDLPEKTRELMVGILQKRLSDSVDLFLQTKQAHWNVKGPDFIALHELFDKVYLGVQEYVDMIAERIVQLGGTADGSVRTAARNSSLKEYPGNIASGQDHVEALSTALAAYGKEVRQAIDHATESKDADTADIFTEISRGTDQWTWFVEAHSQASK